ncbi:hypothetical protein MYMA111404_03715 [Mycoplasma marinum]|uniref:Uncharacterized protein n=1 Tax=Mycoplasma marinum TaxID=1937190 RepID=A0A4R0XTL1_9MOLU|nr:hypothetical protein [Mycoplasma marinum]TCG10979.1 hypothetical protein C4B24_03390 [Mycoplasma marinum]
MNKKINYNEYIEEDQNIDYIKHFDKETTTHENASIISRFLKLNKFKTGFIEESFGYGKTEAAKYLKKYKNQLGLKNWKITYIDATILEMYSDNKLNVFSKIITLIMESFQDENEVGELSLQLSKVNNILKRKNNHLINFEKELLSLKKILNKYKNLIIFDELDRIDKSFAKFLMISIGNNISSNRNILLWVISDRKRIFGKDNVNEIEKYAEYKVRLNAVNSFKIFVDEAQLQFPLKNIYFIKEMINDWLPRKIINIVNLFNASIEAFENKNIKEDPEEIAIHFLASMFYYNFKANNIKHIFHSQNGGLNNANALFSSQAEDVLYKNSIPTNGERAFTINGDIFNFTFLSNGKFEVERKTYLRVEEIKSLMKEMNWHV